MLKKTITYTDYNGNSRTEDFSFNLNEAELAEMVVSVDGGLTAYGINPVVHSLVIDGIFTGVGSVLSFLPILAGIWFGEYPVFIVTSVLSAACDMVFVIMQRYNRQRVTKLLNRKSVR